MFFGILKAAFLGFFGPLFSRLFPAKTAADQKVDDLEASQKDAANARKISDDVDQKDLSDVESDLDKRVRDPNT